MIKEKDDMIKDEDLPQFDIEEEYEDDCEDEEDGEEEDFELDSLEDSEITIG